MEYSDIIIFIMELVGTIAFAASGALTAIQRRMDLFGVNVLGVTTAVGGGLVRDLILGQNPPAMFRDSTYAMTAILTSTILFICVYISRKTGAGRHMRIYDILLLVGDTIGLGIFSVMGSYAAVRAGYAGNRFLIVFVGVITGVGGGMLRDIMAGNMPYILVKHVYAVASLAGALTFVLLIPYTDRITCMFVGAAVVMVIRFLAAYYRWNLPKIYWT